jgi:hypothetical protein
MDQSRFNLKLGLYKYRAVLILKYDAIYTKYSFKHMEKLSLVVAFASSRRVFSASHNGASLICLLLIFVEYHVRCWIGGDGERS